MVSSSVGMARKPAFQFCVTLNDQANLHEFLYTRPRM